MRFLRNIPSVTPVVMTEMIEHTGPQIASKSLINDSQKEIRFFSFAKGEDIDKETFEMDTLLIILAGSFKVVFDDRGEAVVKNGEMIGIGAGTPYGIEALEEGKLMSILVAA